MDNEFNNKEKEALKILDKLIPIVFDAEKKLSSARNWSFLDVLGGGFIIDIIKHMKLGSAKNYMDEASVLLQELSEVLGGLQIPIDYRMQLGGFSTFSDFVFDGFFVADAYMTAKIMTSLNEVRKLKYRLVTLQEKLRSIDF